MAESQAGRGGTAAASPTALAPAAACSSSSSRTPGPRSWGGAWPRCRAPPCTAPHQRRWVAHPCVDFVHLPCLRRPPAGDLATFCLPLVSLPVFTGRCGVEQCFKDDRELHPQVLAHMAADAARAAVESPFLDGQLANVESLLCCIGMPPTADLGTGVHYQNCAR